MLFELRVEVPLLLVGESVSSLDDIVGDSKPFGFFCGLKSHRKVSQRRLPSITSTHVISLQDSQ
jgi:hypothetical protein